MLIHGRVWRGDASHGDGTAKRLPHHVQQKQVPSVCGAFSEEEVEAIAEAQVARLVVTTPGRLGMRPAVHAGEVVQESIQRADEAASLARTAVPHVGTHLAVHVHVIVDRPGSAAMDGVRARDTDGLHQVLHGVAPEIAAGGGAAHMALADGLELIAACRAHHMTRVALPEYVVSMSIRKNDSWINQ